MILEDVLKCRRRRAAAVEPKVLRLCSYFEAFLYIFKNCLEIALKLFLQIIFHYKLVDYNFEFMQIWKCILDGVYFT